MSTVEDPKQNQIQKKQILLRITQRWLPFVILVIPAVIMSLWYIQRTMVDVVFLDGFLHVPLVGHFLDGTWSLREMFKLFGEHLLIGYQVLTLLNARLLALDMRLDSIFFLVSFTATAIIIYTDFSRVFNRVRPKFLGLLFIPLAFLCFSLVAPPLFLMSTQFACGSTIALLIAWLLQREFDFQGLFPNRHNWKFLWIFILIPLYYLFFSGAYFPGFVSGLCAMVFFRALFTKKWLDRRTLFVVIESITCAVLYSLAFVLLGAGTTGASNGIAHFFTDFTGTILYYIAGIGGGLVDQHTIETNPSIVLLIGSIMVLISAVALLLFIRTKMYQKTYLPIYCIFYTLGIITAVRFGRGLLGDWGWITNEWYSFHLRFFVIGIVWILLYSLVEYVRSIRTNKESLFQWRLWPIAFILVAFFFIGFCQIKANLAQWQRGLSVHQWLDTKRYALCLPELVDNAPDLLLWSADEVTTDRAVLDKYNLSCFSARDWYGAGSTDTIIPVNGWYGDNWVSSDGSAIFDTPSDGQITLNLIIPEFISNNHIEVRLNSEVIFDDSLVGGAKITFTGQIHKGINIITVTSDQEVSPAALGINSDQRQLAIWLNIHR